MLFQYAMLLIFFIFPALLGVSVALAKKQFTNKGMNRKFFWETAFTWFMRFMVIPMLSISILALFTKGYNAVIAGLAFGFLVAFPINLILIFGWIGQELHFYKYKKKGHANT